MDMSDSGSINLEEVSLANNVKLESIIWISNFSYLK